MSKIERIKWASTFCVLSGILLTNLNIYPLNILLHATGAVGWPMLCSPRGPSRWMPGPVMRCIGAVRPS